MKTFSVYLRDGRTATVHAHACRNEGNRYVFQNADESSLQFFLQAEVIGISESDFPEVAGNGPLEALLTAYERKIITAALEQNGKHLSRAATQLGITRHALRYRIQRLNLDTGCYSDEETTS